MSERGPYGMYLVVDIRPWDDMPDILNAAETKILQVANEIVRACRAKTRLSGGGHVSFVK